ncbi:MAG TPA: GAF domain-containing protein [Frankiaceae bacterium]|nr:GAF domain-containing protein [Frankiaceae bacterium]
MGGPRRHLLLKTAADSLPKLADGIESARLNETLTSASDAMGGAITALSTFDDEGQLVVRACVNVPDISVGQVLDMDTTLAGRIIRSGAPGRVTSHRDEGLFLPGAQRSYGSSMAAPIRSGDSIIGAISVGRLIGQLEYTDDDLAELAAFATFVGVALDLEKEQQRREADLAFEARAGLADELLSTVVGDLLKAATGIYAVLGRVPADQADELIGYVSAVDQAIVDLRRALATVQPLAPDPPGAADLIPDRRIPQE